MASFTNHFCVGFVLTLRFFRRRLSMPREKIALPLLLPRRPMRDPEARMRRSRIAIDPVETGFPGAGMSREMQS
jgi:hypothetical protein